MLAIAIGYGAYWFLTPTQLEVPAIAASSSDQFVLNVTLHNPTFKIVGGEVITVQTEVDIRVPGRNETAILASVPRTYYFLLAPQFSQTISVVMDARPLSNVQYDITFHVDGVGDQTVTVTL